MLDHISVKGARANNLKNIDVTKIGRASCRERV